MLQCIIETAAPLHALGSNNRMEVRMPRGAYTGKQDRKAEHIADGSEKRGVSTKEAEARAWRTVNKQDKGGKNDGSGRSTSRSAAAKKGWETRRRRGNG